MKIFTKKSILHIQMVGVGWFSSWSKVSRPQIKSLELWTLKEDMTVIWDFQLLWQRLVWVQVSTLDQSFFHEHEWLKWMYGCKESLGLLWSFIRRTKLWVFLDISHASYIHPVAANCNGAQVDSNEWQSKNCVSVLSIRLTHLKGLLWTKTTYD